ncbi:hypothetical protein [uncultured Methylobacterium sp.]|uniref:hypothetical protein n=1 Tax=uncultured Methylobacterium sp. TaxID=157278 RepID=UPI0035CAC223
MNLDGTRNAKAEVFRQIFKFQEVASTKSAGQAVPSFVPAPGTAPHRDIVGGRRKRKRDPRDLIALGVLPPEGHNRNPEDLSLGIFIQKQDLRQHPIVEAAQRLARGETKVIYTGPVRRRALDPLNSGKCRPLLVGGSVGHYGVTAGTIACICRHREGGVGILSNNHILANTDKGSAGDIVLQPGRQDGGRRNDPDSRIAVLFRAIPIAFEAESRNFVDCAFATLLGDIEHDGSVVTDPQDAATSWRVGKIVEELLTNDPVRKVGRTTGYTQGKVTSISVDNLVVAMALGTGERLARFDNQIAVESEDRAFSQGGDSGALIFTADGSPAALLFAGTETGGIHSRGVTFANPIRPVLDALELEIHTGA